MRRMSIALMLAATFLVATSGTAFADETELEPPTLGIALVTEGDVVEVLELRFSF